jgi:FtsH-binding integral membrane protein
MIVGLLIGLIAIIIVQIVGYFLLRGNPNSNYKGWSKYITYFIIILFSLFVSYDTIAIFREAKNCKNYPNYPKSSVNFFLDILNLFVSLMNSYS